MHFNVRGRELLEAVVAAGTNPHRIARRLELSRADPVYRWLGGRNRPEPHLRAALERLFGIPADAWMTDEERTVAFGESGGRAAGHAPLTSAEEVNS